jgi:CheY-like chemotaxis protein
MDNLLAGRCILIVEDDMMIRLTLEDMLVDLGCASVGAAATIEQALSLIETHRYDAATLDVNLNGKISFPVAAALVVRGVPFAFSTGYGDQFLREGYTDRPILKKPFGSTELASILTDILA